MSRSWEEWKQIRKPFEERSKQTTQQRWRICRHPLHDPADPFVPPDGWTNSKSTKFCRACNKLAADNNRAIRVAQKRVLKRKAVENAIKKAVIAPNMPEVVVRALKSWGGVEGYLTAIKEEFDAAEKGSTLRKEYLVFIGRFVMANAMSGGGESIENYTNEELDEALDEQFGPKQSDDEDDEDEEVGDEMMDDDESPFDDA